MVFVFLVIFLKWPYRCVYTTPLLLKYVVTVLPLDEGKDWPQLHKLTTVVVSLADMYVDVYE